MRRASRQRTLILITVVVLHATSRADARDGASPPVTLDTAPEQEPDPQLDERPDPELLDRRIRLGAPLSPPRDAFFYAPLGLPRLAAARTAPTGTIRFALGGSHTRSTESLEAGGHAQRFDGIFHEWARFDLEAAVLDRLTLFASARIAGWDERRDVFRVFSDGPLPSVRGEDRKLLFGSKTGRHDNLADITLGARIELWRLREDDVTAFGIAVQAKIPISRASDLTNAGTVDVAVTALGSIRFGDLVLHANLGGVFPIGNETIFEGSGARLDPFVQAAVGLTWIATDRLSLGVGLDGATPAWSGAGIVDQAPITATAGARLAVGRASFELGGGLGLTDGAPDTLFWFGIGYWFGRDDDDTLVAASQRRRALGRLLEGEGAGR